MTQKATNTKFQAAWKEWQDGQTISDESLQIIDEKLESLLPLIRALGNYYHLTWYVLYQEHERVQKMILQRFIKRRIQRRKDGFNRHDR